MDAAVILHRDGSITPLSRRGATDPQPAYVEDARGVFGLAPMEGGGAIGARVIDAAPGMRLRQAGWIGGDLLDAAENFVGDAIHDVEKGAEAVGGGVVAAAKFVAPIFSEVASALSRVPGVGTEARAAWGGLSALAKGENVFRGAVVAAFDDPIARGAVRATLGVADGESVFAAVKGAVHGGIDDVREAIRFAALVAPFVPGIGTGVAAALGAANALAQGKTLTDAMVEGARSAVPGGVLAQTAFDVGVAVAQKKPIGDLALEIVRNNLPGGELAQGAFDVAVSAVKGQNVTAAALRAVERELPDVPEVHAAFVAAAGLARGGSLSTAAMEAIRDALPNDDARRGFDASVALAKARSIQEVAGAIGQVAPSASPYAATARDFVIALARGVPIQEATLTSVGRQALGTMQAEAGDLLQSMQAKASAALHDKGNEAMGYLDDLGLGGSAQDAISGGIQEAIAGSGVSLPSLDDVGGRVATAIGNAALSLLPGPVATVAHAVLSDGGLRGLSVSALAARLGVPVGAVQDAFASIANAAHAIGSGGAIDAALQLAPSLAQKVGLGDTLDGVLATFGGAMAPATDEPGPIIAAKAIPAAQRPYHEVEIAPGVTEVIYDDGPIVAASMYAQTPYKLPTTGKGARVIPSRSAAVSTIRAALGPGASPGTFLPDPALLTKVLGWMPELAADPVVRAWMQVAGIPQAKGLELPPAGAAPAGTAVPAGVPVRWLVVAGDTPIGITHAITGDPHRYPELIAANPGKPTNHRPYPLLNFATLLPGEHLAIPAAWNQYLSNDGRLGAGVPFPPPPVAVPPSPPMAPSAPSPTESIDLSPGTYAQSLPAGAVRFAKIELGAWNRAYQVGLDYPTAYTLQQGDNEDAHMISATRVFQAWRNRARPGSALREDGTFDRPTHDALTEEIAALRPAKPSIVSPALKKPGAPAASGAGAGIAIVALGAAALLLLKGRG